MPNNVNDFDVFNPNQLEGIYYEAPIVAMRAPTVNDKYEIGKVWIDRTNDDAYFITNVTAGSAVWINAGGGTGVFASLTATTGDITATLGDIVASAGDLIATAGSATLGGLGAGTCRTDAAGVITAFADGLDGQIPIGTTGGVPTWATLTAGGGITIVEAAGAITITNPGATGTTSGTDVGGPVAPTGGGLTTFEGYDLNIQTDGATANTVRIRLADDVVTVASLTATADFDVLGGTTTIESDTDGAEAIYLHTDAGTSEQISIRVDQGTAANSLNIASDDGGLNIYAGLASTDAINITAAAGGIDVDAADQINILCTENAADAIVIAANAGGIDITGTGVAGEDIDITTTASVNLVSTEDAAEAIYLRANGGVSETIRIHSDNGTSATSIDVDTDVGGMTFTAGLASNDAINFDATNGGFDLDAALQINLASAQAAADAIVIDASDAAGGIDCDYGTGGYTIDGANGAYTLQTGTGNILIGADAVQHNVTLGNVTGTTAVALNSGTGGVAVNTTGAGDFVVTSADTVLIDAAGVLELNSSAGVIGIGNDAISQNMNLGTAGARVITIGNVTGATQIVGNAGTGGIQFTSTGAGDITLDSADTVLIDSAGVLELNSSAGVINIGNDDIDQAINVGTVGERVITVGNIVGVTQIVGNAGTGGIQFTSTGAGDITLDSSDTVLIDSAGVLELNSSAGVINIGNDDIDQAMNIGTTGERVITIGNVVGVAQIIGNSGTGGIQLTSTGAGTITLDSGSTVLIDSAGVLELNSSAGIINIGNDDIDQNINIGTVGERVITVGNIVGVTGLAFNAGTAGITMASTGAGDITINSDDTLLLDSDGILEFNSSAGIISIGNDADDLGIQIGAAGVRPITIGNATAGSSIVATGGDTGDISVVGATVSGAGAALTLNAKIGTSTHTGIVTNAAAQETFTITNSEVAATSKMIVTVTNLGANDSRMTLERVKPATGSFTVDTQNNGAAACNGNVNISWIILG